MDRTERLKRAPFLLVEFEDNDLVLLNCDDLRRFRVDDRLLRVLASLDEPCTPEELRSEHGITSEDLGELVRLGVVQQLDGGPGPAAPRTYWNPFDLAVHRQQNVGGFRESEVQARGDAPPPAFKERPNGEAVPLPPASGLPASLDEVLERRRTVRTFSERPLLLDELSSVLHHSARVVGVVRDEALGEHAFRPFPSGGARSELEIYVVANDVSGLSPGAYYYDARAHELVHVRARDEHQVGLNKRVAEATGDAINRDPQVVFLITAVFGRVMWKYTGIALGVINRNTGCLYQTLYLVATALGLAPCAIGAGPELANARWLGLDPLVESQVGCLLLGTKD